MGRKATHRFANEGHLRFVSVASVAFGVDVKKRGTRVSIFHFLKSVMNFLKGVVSICHSFRSMGQPGFQVVDLCTAQCTPAHS